jgi:alkanesulfonate monooxygenase SsuD/methylene tetrahydromethanopterin reductase-like flavin-dependent oxidoreductase (luciferase family)
VQQPHPPIYLGGHGIKTLKRVVRYCDGWMPIPVRAGDLRKEIAELRALAKAAGREPHSLTVSLYGVGADAEQLRTYAAAGADRAIFGLPAAARDKALSLLDRYAEVARSLRQG